MPAPPASPPGASSISWWSWRPGIRPMYALLIGGSVTCIALTLCTTGLMTLFFELHTQPVPTGHAHGGSVVVTALVLLIGLLLLPYPLALARWGWKDVVERPFRGDKVLRGRVIARRTTTSQRIGRAGMLPSGTRRWYGIAIAPEESASGSVRIFAVSRAIHDAVQEGAIVQITYSPFVRYVYGLKHV